jgi:hypothetical protein
MVILRDNECNVTVLEGYSSTQERNFTVVYGLQSTYHETKESAYKEALSSIDHALRCEGIEIEEI